MNTQSLDYLQIDHYRRELEARQDKAKNRLRQLGGPGPTGAERSSEVITLRAQIGSFTTALSLLSDVQHGHIVPGDEIRTMSRLHDLRLPDPRNGDIIRVVIAGDVIALPNEGWSGSGYGHYITEEWLLHSASPPLPRKGRRRLAQAIVAALQSVST